MKKIFFFTVFSITSVSALSKDRCIVGNEKNSQLQVGLKSAQTESPITQKIYQKYNLLPKTEADSNCPTGDCRNNTAVQKLSALPTGGAQASPAYVHLNEACVEVAAQVKAGSAEIDCPSRKTGKFNFCYPKSMANYQSAVTSDFYNCLRKTQDFPLTIDALFEMYTLESGFKPYYANTGGTGMGQLTGIFIKDIHQKHRGRPILQSIADSTDSQCEAAKLIAQKDLQKEPSLANKCDFVQVGEGLERNILYTLVGMSNSWNKDIGPLMKDYIKKNERDPAILEVQKKALLNAYGAGGRAAARAAIRRLTKLKPADFAKAMTRPLYTAEGQNLTTYTTNIALKQKQIEKIMNEPLLSEYKKNGARACLDHMF
jgi:hypothetical protein